MQKPSPNLAFSRSQRPLFVILSGPSGVGKDAVLAKMKETLFPIYYIVTMTTRPRRPAEKDKVDYQFVSKEEFLKLKQNNELLESANVYGNYYGVPKQDVVKNLEAGRDVLVKVDVQGVETIKKAMPQAVAIFLSPPSKDELLTRLKHRHTESEAEVRVRLQAAEDEFKQLPSFDYVVVNYRDELERAVSAIGSIIAIEKCINVPDTPSLENQLE
jgi:guanylate kinase